LGVDTRSGSDPSGGEDAITNEIVVGYSATGGGSNTVTLGNSSIGNFYCQVALTVVSDERIKRDVQQSSIGLSFINELNPVTFKFKNPVDYPDEIKPEEYTDREIIENVGPTGIKKCKLTKAKNREVDDDTIQIGLIAQQVEKVLLRQGVDLELVKTSNRGKKAITYESLIMPLITAVQELSSRLDALER